SVVIKPQARPNHHVARDYAQNPMIVYWEMTQACGLACRHCRAPEGYALVRAFIGGARAEHLVEQDDAALAEMARDELRAMMGITATPVLTKVYRWHKANPQYEVGHQARIAEIDQLIAQQHGLHLAGGAYHGVGIPDCIESGMRIANEILKICKQVNM
ncbi:MAG TPA: FAD-dependent oxidoreductase, partial [Anaerolineae bacterium]